MNAHSKIHETAAVFKSNRSQAVRLPKDFAFPEGTSRVAIRKIGNQIILSPIVKSWHDFAKLGPNPDFPERDQPPVQERDWSFDD